MQFYSLYLLEGRIELSALEHEPSNVKPRGRLISTQKGYQRAYEFGIALAQEKQLPLVDRVKSAPRAGDSETAVAYHDQ